ncbi:hypothetical protein DL93DRAFT_2092237 [Clavulina sp. PMI_390]|nr:hypothetical protein DL93DRAFT_2092237 [Clavulina sp. PMI_390]
MGADATVALVGSQKLTVGQREIGLVRLDESAGAFGARLRQSGGGEAPASSWLMKNGHSDAATPESIACVAVVVGEAAMCGAVIVQEALGVSCARSRHSMSRGRQAVL